MGRLCSVKPGLVTAPTRLAPTDAFTEQQRNQQRSTKEPWRAWYKLARWQRLRLLVFTRDLFTCQWQGCGRIEGKLGNEAFVAKAPEAVIAKEREKLTDYQSQLTKLKEQQETIKSL